MRILDHTIIVDDKVVITYAKHESTDEYTDMLSRFIRDVVSKDDFNLKDNYFFPRFKMHEQLAISLLVKEDEIIGFSTINYSPIDKSCARLLNRFYLAPGHRSTPQKPTFAVRQDRIAMLNQQVAFLDNWPNIRHAFLSREHPGKHYLANLTEVISELVEGRWEFHPEKVLVCEDKEAKSCWQHVIYRHIHLDPFPLLSNTITEDKWKTLK